jgi:hypothetical protein
MKVSLLFILVLPIAAQQPVVRARFTPAESVLVGQPVRLTVDVLVPSFFTSAPEFPTIEIPSAITAAVEGQPPHLTETIGGTSYAGVSSEYLIYPQKVGEFTLPPAEVVFRYSVGGATSSPETRLKLPPVKFTAVIPAEAQGLDYFIATISLTVSQHIDKKLTGLKAGDTIHRTITVRGSQVFSMFLPPLEFPDSDGLRIYKDQPKLNDERTVRGEFVGGSRTDGASYLIQKAGSYTLPEIDLSWWDLSSSRMRTTRLKAVTFTAAANPDYRPDFTPYVQPEVPPQPEPTSPWRWAIPAVAALVLLAGAWWLIPRLSRVLSRHREQRRNSVETQFQRFRDAAAHNDAPRAMQELFRWLDRLKGSGGATIRGAVATLPGSGWGKNAAELERVLYANEGSSGWHGKPLAETAAAAAKAYQHSLHQTKERETLLPPLNP